jgi:raffinose synthase
MLLFRRSHCLLLLIFSQGQVRSSSFSFFGRPNPGPRNERLLRMALPYPPDDCDRVWSFDSTAFRINKSGKQGRLFTLELKHQVLTRTARPGERRSWFERSLGKLTASSTENKLCLHRFKIWWIRPVFCKGAIPSETIMILCRDSVSKKFRLILPSASCALHGLENEEIVVTSDLAWGVIYSGVGDDPYSLIEEGVAMFTGLNSAPRKCLDIGLGWCSWNAFYTQISGAKMVDAIAKIKAKNVPIQWTILDDGWQHTTNDEAENGEQWSLRLAGFRESPTKFAELSLKATVTRIKEFGLTKVWVWHTLAGYWLGLDPGSSEILPSSLYFPEFPSGIMENDLSTEKEWSVTKGVGLPDDADEFFSSYHEYLLCCGVDGVKVDSQAVVSMLTSASSGTTDDYGKTRDQNVDLMVSALAKSVKMRFGNKTFDPDCAPPIINCMAHDPRIFYKLPSLYHGTYPMLRVSDDHYPDNPFSHGSHIVACAFNSLLLEQVSIPDWDMFTTCLDDEQYVRIHSVSRCVSGGPVYLSDPPDRIRKAVVDWVSCTDGTILTCRESAKPILEHLLEDPLDYRGKPLVLYNTNGSKDRVTNGVLAVFNVAGSGEWCYKSLNYVKCQSSPEALSKTVFLKPTDIWNFASKFIDDQRFLAIPFFSVSPIILLESASSEFKMSLGPLDCDLVTIFPILNVNSTEFVILGFDGKLNGAGATLDSDCSVDGIIKLWIKGSGTFGIMIRSSHGNSSTGTFVHVEFCGERIPSWSVEGGETSLGFERVFFEVEPLLQAAYHGQTRVYEVHVI